METADKVKGYNLSVAKAAAIINYLADQEGSRSLSQISSALGYPVSTTYRLAASLKAERFVEQDPLTKKYGIGLRLFEIGLSNNYYKLLAKRAGPVLQEVAEKTGESANLAVLAEGQIVYIAQRHSRQIMKTFVQLGKRSPVHCTGVGKVLISELPQEEVERIVEKNGLEKHTSNTITTLAKLLKELEKVREQQFAIDKEEREEGVFCIAAPVYGSKKKIIAAISISGPTGRINGKKIADLASLLQESAHKLSKM